MSKVTKNERISTLERQVTALITLVKMKGYNESEPQLKQLDQSVFDGLDEKWRFAAIDLSGEAWVYREQPKIDKGDDRWSPSNTPPNSIGTGYDASNWQNSLIERDIAKELTGSDLCHGMLKRGDKAVMCKINESNSMAIIIGYKESRLGGWVFHSHRHSNHYIVTPINNKGEPLTAAEAGL